MTIITINTCQTKYEGNNDVLQESTVMSTGSTVAVQYKKVDCGPLA